MGGQDLARSGDPTCENCLEDSCSHENGQSCIYSSVVEVDAVVQLPKLFESRWAGLEYESY